VLVGYDRTRVRCVGHPDRQQLRKLVAGLHGGQQRRYVTATRRRRPRLRREERRSLSRHAAATGAAELGLVSGDAAAVATTRPERRD
jgi:hypothetical protein